MEENTKNLSGVLTPKASLSGKMYIPESLGTTDHAALENRDAADQHPVSAITGLQEALYSTGAAVKTHNESGTSHPDLRKLIEQSANGGVGGSVFVGLYTNNGDTGEIATTREEWLAAYEAGKVCIMRNNSRTADQYSDWRIALLQDIEPYGDYGDCPKFLAPTPLGLQIIYVIDGGHGSDTVYFAHADTAVIHKWLVAVPVDENTYTLFDMMTEEPITFDEIGSNLLSWVVEIIDATTNQIFTLGGVSDTLYFTSLSVDVTTGDIQFRALSCSGDTSGSTCKITTYTLGSAL